MSSILTTDSSSFRAPVCLFFFLLKCKVVSCCITVSSVKGYRLLSYIYPQRRYYTPYSKVFFQIFWGINVKAKNNCLSGLREDKSSLVGLNFLLGLHFKTEIVTQEIVICKLLLLKRPTISQVFQFRSVCDIFFPNHLAPPSKGLKGELMPKAPAVQSKGMWRFLFLS